jgi:segregation and condensation protein A
MEYGIKLEMFEGPMDLLLHLIQKNDLDIYDIPISKITSEYVAYIDMMKNLNLEVAGDFLVMAATLMKIKSKMLLPTHENEESGEELKNELVNRILEYKKFKEASKILLTNLEDRKDIYSRNMEPEFKEDDFGVEVTIFNLLDAFRTVLEKAKRAPKEIIKEECTVEEKMKFVLFELETREFLAFFSLFSEDETKRSVIVTFLAMLELLKTGQITVKQDKAFSEIRIYKKAKGTDEKNN